MADQKISQLASGTNAQAGDLFVIARGATNLSLTTAQLFNAPSATATLGGLNVDSGTLFVDAVNNRVGVGTASPVSNLHLLGVASANADFAHETVSAGTAARTRYLRNGVVQFLAGLGAFSGNDTYEIAGASGPFITLNTSGNLGLGVTPSAGRGVLQLSAGIGFPATQVSSSDANTLDDYEEGTWTGTLKGGTADPTTPVTATGKYTKIGRQVTVAIYFNNVNTTGASGAVSVTGLPFTEDGTRAVGAAGTFNFDLNTGSSIFMEFSGTAFGLVASKDNAAWVSVLHNAGAARYLRATGTYFV